MNDMNLTDLNNKYKSCPVYVSEQVIGGRKYIVYSHFVGSKDLDTVISEIAFNHAADEVIKVK